MRGRKASQGRGSDDSARSSRIGNAPVSAAEGEEKINGMEYVRIFRAGAADENVSEAEIMHCITAPNAIMCSFRCPEPAECHDLIWSEGKACKACAYKKCEYAGLVKREVDKKETARWKEKRESEGKKQ